MLTREFKTLGIILKSKNREIKVTRKFPSLQYINSYFLSHIGIQSDPLFISPLIGAMLRTCGKILCNTSDIGIIGKKVSVKIHEFERSK